MLDTDRKQQAIEITGVAPQLTVQMQFDRIRQEGILVDLNIAGTGMFQRTPNWAELAIPEFAGDRRASRQQTSAYSAIATSLAGPPCGPSRFSQ